MELIEAKPAEATTSIKGINGATTYGTRRTSGGQRTNGSLETLTRMSQTGGNQSERKSCFGMTKHGDENMNVRFDTSERK